MDTHLTRDHCEYEGTQCRFRPTRPTLVRLSVESNTEQPMVTPADPIGTVVQEQLCR